MDNYLEEAIELDNNDKLRAYRDKFHFPSIHDDLIYLNGNSLGLLPKQTKKYVEQELNDWKTLGVEGHFTGDTPWLSYHKLLVPPLTRLLGAKEHEVVIMNTLTTNLHLMMVSFYRPTPERYKILVEYSPFPSDRYAVASQIRYHGFNPQDAILELRPDEGEIVTIEQINKVIQDHGDELALILLGGVNYYTGQTYPMRYISELAKRKGIRIGLDLAHAVGNVKLELNKWGVDFAVFCTYKYLNSGPGSIGGCFVHEKHAEAEDLPRFEGWWGNKESTRFLMKDTFEGSYGVEGWQLSNPPILSLAAIKSSLDLFDQAGLENLIEKTSHLTAFARRMLAEVENQIEILTPNEESSGAQLSIVIKEDAKEVHRKLNEEGVICDWREPNVIRVAFVPLYNSFNDIYEFVTRLITVMG